VLLTFMITRRSVLSRTSLSAALTATFSLGTAGYATAVEPHRVRVTRYSFTPAKWPLGQKLRIAVLTDFHAHPRNMGEADVAAVVARTNALKPDVSVVLGDYGSQSPGPVEPEVVASLLRGLVAPQGVYAIQGNHDWTDDSEAIRRRSGPTRVERALRDAGIALLENEAVPLKAAPPIWIAGLESEEAQSIPQGVWQGSRKFDRYRIDTLAQVLGAAPNDATVILLAHEPDIFAQELDPRIALTLSGHTHGGQIRIFGWSPFIPSRYGRRYVYGHVVENNRHLVVSAGLGSHFVGGLPVRIGAPPEIVIVDLGDAPSA
jgi:predicted MPP superfamily phosphohydrolase